jgi:hypothetical protein
VCALIPMGTRSFIQEPNVIGWVILTVAGQ